MSNYILIRFSAFEIKNYTLNFFVKTNAKKVALD